MVVEGTYIGGTHDTTDLLHRVQIGAETTVHGENLLINDCSDGQAVEAVRKCLPQLNVVTALALVVEAIDSVDRRTLVVASEDEEVLGVLDLVGEQQADSLEGLLASVDVVTEEEVVGLRREAAVLEKTQQVVILAVDIAADLRGLPSATEAPQWTSGIRGSGICAGHEERKATYLNRSLKLEKDGLGDEDLAGLGAEVADLRLQELDLFAGAAASDLEQPIDYGVEIDFVLVCHRGEPSRR